MVISGHNGPFEFTSALPQKRTIRQRIEHFWPLCQVRGEKALRLEADRQEP